MNISDSIKRDLFSINAENFKEYALKVFHYQALNNKVYANYLHFLKINPFHITEIEAIPFLPIEFFKTLNVTTGNKAPEIIFESSGTTGQERSKHYVADADFYKKVCEEIFNRLYFPLNECVFFALLPSYAERQGSSLIYMVEHFIAKSAAPELGFYLNNYDEMIKKMKSYEHSGLKIVLIGVTFALLDLAEEMQPDLKNILVMETGGMKGRRKEMIRDEVHDILKNKFNCKTIASEYGMTELLSQAYATEDGIFSVPSWVKILLRNPDDPFDKSYQNKRGGINVIDLANIDSCAFIETKDLGEMLPNGQFKVLGRFDNSEIRGCNLLVS